MTGTVRVAVPRISAKQNATDQYQRYQYQCNENVRIFFFFFFFRITFRVEQ